MGKFTAYKLPLSKLGAGRHEFTFRPDKQFFTDMEYADIHGSDLTVTVVVDHKAGGDYGLSMHVEGTVTLLCDRCLDHLEWPIDCGYDITVRYGDSYDDSSDTVLVIPSSDDSLNIAYMLFDTVVLGIPMRHVHPQGKCNRAMTQALKRHRAPGADDPDAELKQDLIDEIDSLTDDAPADEPAPTE